ncbi:MAG: DUF1801 domain-containing protein [Rhizobiales bacterium]|nr:DUF1801 domain-containing protein [Hyphomicrobiales bacterium]
MNAAKKIEIIDKIEATIAEIAPSACTYSKYGGMVIEGFKSSNKSIIGGYFTYTKHISLEFSQGVKLKDSKGILLGNGKHRRHIKLICITDFTKYDCRTFLEQAFDLEA